VIDEATAGRFVAKLYHAIGVAKLHDLSNAALDQPIAELKSALDSIVASEGRASLALDPAAWVVFLNGKVVKLTGQTSSAAATKGMTKRHAALTLEGLAQILRSLGVGEVRFQKALEASALRSFVSVLQKAKPGPDPAATWKELAALFSASGLARAGVTLLSFEQSGARAVDHRVKVDPEQAVCLAYGRLLALLREYMKHLRSDELHRYFARKILRAVQGLQSLATTMSAELLSLTLIKDADDYAFNHAVNTSILSMLVASRIGLSRNQVSQVGFAALLHGLGKFRTDAAIVETAPEKRTATETRTYRVHPYRGVDAFLESRRIDDAFLIGALVGFEHDLRDQPPVRVARTKTHPFSRIVAVCEAYDALTTARGGLPATLPDRALAQLLEGKPASHDPVIVRVFASLLGLFPPGSAVLLDSKETAVVVHPNPDDPRRPLVAVVRDASGNDVDGEMLDLALKDSKGAFTRNIVKAVDPRAANLKIPEYLSAS
jgi:HD-GYP domain-containing protein (c-di-GMP phosphodiesterase class II)